MAKFYKDFYLCPLLKIVNTPTNHLNRYRIILLLIHSIDYTITQIVKKLN